MKMAGNGYLSVALIIAILLLFLCETIISPTIRNLAFMGNTTNDTFNSTACKCDNDDGSVMKSPLVEARNLEVMSRTLPRHKYTSAQVDFSSQCNITKALTSLHDPQIPLTSSILEELRGCMVLLFWRSPRCGSTAIYFLLNELSKNLTFRSILGHDGISSHNHWIRFIDNVTDHRESVSISTHLPADDVISEPKKPAALVNVIRHPIDQVISIFKLIKYGDRREKGLAKNIASKCNVTISEYLLKNGLASSCVVDSMLSLRFLCGNCEGCESRSVCLQQAKKNVETLYLTVGISENIPAFLLVMETLLPQFFHGALQTYVKMSGLYQMFSPDPFRNETLTPEATDYLNNVLAPDMELYHFVQQRCYVAVKKVLEFRANNNITESQLLRYRSDAITAT